MKSLSNERYVKSFAREADVMTAVSGADKPLILIVDDTPVNLEVLARTLQSKYEIKAALSGAKALQIAHTIPQPDMILLDVTMPVMDGYEVCRELKMDPATAHIPVIFITARDDIEDVEHGLALGAVDYITQPLSPAIVQARIRTQLALYNQNRELARLVRMRTTELRDTRLNVIQCLGRAAEYKDHETGFHVVRMSHYSRLIAQVRTQNEDWIELVFHASPMHDIGKIGVPDYILKKEGKLNSTEWQVMKDHPNFGAKIIGDTDNPLLKMAKTIALTHHEKWDGSGYPLGLKGDSIPLEGRIVAIADVLDALLSKRPYKEPWTLKEALKTIDEGSGRHFDPALVKALHAVMPQILEVRMQYPELIAA